MQPIISQELGEENVEDQDEGPIVLGEEAINENMILEGALKVKQIYDKAKDGEVF